MEGRKGERKHCGQANQTGRPATVKLSHLKGFFLVLLGDLERRSLFSLNCRTHHSKPVWWNLELVSLYLTVTLIPSLLQLSSAWSQHRERTGEIKEEGRVGWAGLIGTCTRLLRNQSPPSGHISETRLTINFPFTTAAFRRRTCALRVIEQEVYKITRPHCFAQSARCEVYCTPSFWVCLCYSRLQ